jgi:HEAT repeat protein
MAMALVFTSVLTAAYLGRLSPDTIPADSTAVETRVTPQQPVDVISGYASRLLMRFKKSPLFITILYIVIIYSIVTLITLLIIILMHRSRLAHDQKLKEYLLEKYQNLLMDYLFDDQKQEEAFNELNRIASNQMNRQVLIDQMIDLSVNLKGEIREKIQELYLRLGLKKDSMRKAYSRKWHSNVKGFRELAFMNIRDANDKIVESLNSGNEILRMEAQIAMVRLADGEHYEFLDLLKKPLSLWEQVTLHELQIQHNLKVPRFKRWFSSENESVVMFALEMVAWYKQRGVVSEIIRLFEHSSEQVRFTAYRVCGEIGLKMVLPEMVRKYPGETFRNRLEILQTFAKVPVEKYLKFLKSVLDSEDDVQLQIAATKAMENTGEPGISMLIKLMKSKSEYKNYQIIIRHVLDGRIY